MCWFYMGIAQIASEPPSSGASLTEVRNREGAESGLPPPLVKRANVEKNVLQTILASLYIPPLSGNAQMETTHFKKKLPLVNKQTNKSLFNLIP